MLPIFFLALGTGLIWVGWSSIKEKEFTDKFGNKITRADTPLLFVALCVILLLTGCLFLLGAVGLTLRSTRTQPRAAGSFVQAIPSLHLC